MVKISIYIIAVILMVFSCSPKKEVASKVTETRTKKVYEKTIYFNENYTIENLTLEVDKVLLTNKDLSIYKVFFEEELLPTLKEKGFEIVKSEEESNYQLNVKKFSLKEFKLQVDGPSVNVVESKIDYELSFPNGSKGFSEVVNKENILPFEGFIFQDMVTELSFKVVENLERIAQ